MMFFIILTVFITLSFLNYINYADCALFRGSSDVEFEPWGGNFYWVCVYKRALSADEIEQVINYNENY